MAGTMLLEKEPTSRIESKADLARYVSVHSVRIEVHHVALRGICVTSGSSVPIFRLVDVLGTWPYNRLIGQCLKMYGPPSECKGKCGDEESLRQCIRPLVGEDLLAMMRYARACPDKSVGR
jgi:hypothetical protein